MNSIPNWTKAEIGHWAARFAQPSLGEELDPSQVRQFRTHKHVVRTGQDASKTRHPITSLYYLPTRNKSTAVCIKAFDVSLPRHRDFFQREVDMLRKLGKAEPGSGRPLVPPIFAVDADAGLLAMQWIDGRHMKANLMKGVWLRRDISGDLHDCGTWLRQFHVANGLQQAPAPASEMMQALDEAVADLSPGARHRVFACRSFAEALKSLQEQVPKVDGAPVDWSLQHGDFSPSNLIRETSTGAILGIDFGYAMSRAPVTLDLGYFLVSTSDLLISPRPGPSLTRRLFESLAHGYKATHSDAELQWLEWCMLYVAVERHISRTNRALRAKHKTRLTSPQDMARLWQSERSVRMFLVLKEQRTA